jgi:hypothetical protein
MKLVLKSIKNQLYEIDINSLEDKVSYIKEIICNKFSFDLNSLKLLHKGVILDNSKSLADCNVSENDQIIIMNIKAKPVIQEEVKSETTNLEKVEKKQIDYSTEIASLMELGFTFERSKHAIKRTKGDLTLAMEMLFNNLDVEKNMTTLEGNLPKENIIESIASICKIAKYNNPKFVRNIIEGLEETNPEIALAIKNNQEDFNHLMDLPITQEDINIYNNFTGKSSNQNQLIGHNQQTSNSNSVLSGPTRNLENKNQVNNLSSESLYNNAIHNNTSLKQKYNLSDEEYEAVLRLKEFGYSLIECIETYIACDKNEEQALNFLLDSNQN